MDRHAALEGATIVFDLDGTLVDSAPDVIGAVNAILTEEGFEPLDYDQGRPLISRGAYRLLQHGLETGGAPDAGARTSALFDRFLTYYNDHIANESRLFPGVVEALTALKRLGAKRVVCTNKPTNLSRLLLDRLAIAGLFDAIVGIDAVTAAKPDPAHLIEAVNAVRGDLGRSVMVGDADTDARAARGAGTPLILVEFGYTEIPAADLAPDILLRRFDDLVAACVTLLNPGQDRLRGPTPDTERPLASRRVEERGGGADADACRFA